MKKVITLGVVAMAFALTVSAAFASYRSDRNGYSDRRSKDCCPEVTVEADTNTTVKNDVRAYANSGDNYVSSYSYRGMAKIETGVADTLNSVGTSVTGAEVDVQAPRRGEVNVEAETNTYVRNEVRASSNSGDNAIRSRGGYATIDTGDTMTSNYVDTKVMGSWVVVR